MRVTLRDIAERVNLSHSTVSFVINGRMDVAIPAATRERVLAAAKEMGYRPNRAAQALVRGRTNMIALWMPHSNSAHFPRVQRELANQAAADGFELVTRVHDFGNPHDTKPWEIDDWPVDGLVMLDCTFPGSPQYVVPKGTPLVAIGCFYNSSQEHFGIDMGPGVMEAMSHLKEVGCKRVAFLMCQHASDSARMRCYEECCNRFGITVEFIKSPDWSRESTRASVREHIASSGLPDAIVAYSDGLAIAGMKGVRDSGYNVPTDVLFVGCDGTEEGEYCNPALTTVGQPVGDMCQRAWEALRTRIKEHRASAPARAKRHAEILPAKLIIRESSVRAR